MTSQDVSRVKVQAQTLNGILADRRQRLAEVNAGETGHALNDVYYLMDSVERFLTHVHVLAEMHKELLDRENRMYSSLNGGMELEYQPHGNCFLVIPSNAAIPLAAIVPFAFACIGNNVTVLCSSKVRGTCDEIITAVAAVFPQTVRLATGSVRDNIDKALSHRSIDLLYFTGPSSPFAELSERCAKTGIELIFEGEGRSVAVITPSVTRKQLREAAQQLYDAKVFWHGQMCSAPNLIAVHADDVVHLKGELLNVASSRNMSPPRFLSHSDSDLLRTNDLTLVITDDMSVAFQHEWFAPIAYLYAYDNIQEVRAVLATAPFRLQLDVFGSDADLEAMMLATKFPRYCYNMTPSLQDPLLPWGNYGKSGSSPLVDFYRKGLRRVLVEDWGN